MAKAYTPGLEVSANSRVEKLRELPLPGNCLVSVGDRVHAQQAVLRAALPGDLQIIRVAERLGLEPIDITSGMKVRDGQPITKGDVICTVETFFGLFKNSLRSPVTGNVEFFTEANAHLGIRLPSVPYEVNAYVDGNVAAIDPGKSVTIATEGAFIQGIFGVGGERQGTILALPLSNDDVVTAAALRSIQDQLPGSVLIGGACFSSDALALAAELGAQAVVTGSIDSATLFSFVGHEIGVSITGDEAVPLTLIITEGFGTLSLSGRVRKLAEQFQGKSASVNGATQVRAGALRPEVIIPHSDESRSTPNTAPDLTLDIGSSIRIIRVPYFGLFGEVVELPHAPEQIPTGAEVRVLRARLESGEVVTVPRANVELV